MKKSTIVLVLIWVAVVPAQEKWGQVAEPIRNMTSFDKDSSADAVILFDVGEIEITSDFKMMLFRHIRFKILTEKGMDYANVKIPFYSEDFVTNIEAQTISPQGNKAKLNKKNIFEESWKERWRQKVFAIPGVEVGSVVEYRYRLESDYLTFLEPWRFQNKVYTEFSQVSVLMQPGFVYNSFLTNMIGRSVVPIDEKVVTPDGDLARFTWNVHDMPALTNEPFMRSHNDYLASLFFQLQAYQREGFKRTFLDNWDDIVKRVHGQLKDFYHCSNALQNLLKSLVTDSIPPDQNINAIYSYVRDQIVTEWMDDFYPKRTPDQVLTEKKGTPVEKNIMFLVLAREAGLEASPLLISTRDNGLITVNYPHLQQFNKIVVLIELGGQRRVLDASERHYPINILPEMDIVESGLIVDGNQAQFFNLPPVRDGKNMAINTKARMDEIGNIHAVSLIRYEGYGAVIARQQLESQDKNDYLTLLLSDNFSSARLDSFKIENMEQCEAPLIIHISYQIENYGQIAGNKIYVIPPLLNSVKKNPFQHKVRNFPVDFIYPAVALEDISLELPPGFKVSEILLPQLINYPGIRFALKSNAQQNTLTFSRRFMIQKAIFGIDEYERLRNLYSEIVNSEQKPFIVEKL